MGNKEWQRAKIEHSGLGRLFDDTRFVDKEKESVIGKLTEGESEVFVINDNPKEMAAMVLQEPRLHYILKKGPKGTIEGLDVPVFERFEDIVSFIDETLKQ
jgi:hypothetical protein